MENIFCIDDNATDRFIAEKYLRELFVNPRVTLLTNSKDAIDKLIGARLSNDQPDYILLDLHMPQVDGWGFLDEIYRLKIDLWCASKVYILSSSVHPEDIEQSKIYPIVRGFISKPLNRQKFNALLAKSDRTY